MPKQRDYRWGFFIITIVLSKAKWIQNDMTKDFRLMPRFLKVYGSELMPEIAHFVKKSGGN